MAEGDLPGVRRSWLISSSSVNIRENYRFVGGAVGEGTYGIVRLGERLTDKQRHAIKVIPKSRVKNADMLTREINIMKEIDHPNIVKLYETYEDNRYIYLVMELCQGGELFDTLISRGHFTEEEAANLCRQMLSAINYLHSLHIAHRDLKPENFLFLENRFDSPLKMIDFGFAKNMEVKAKMNTRAGTAYYISPEVLTGDYNESCDIWSIGVILYMMLSGYPPFDGENDLQIIEAVKAGHFGFPQPVWRSVSEDAKAFIRLLLDVNPQTRITAADALSHPWIQGFITSPGLPLQINIHQLQEYQNFNRLKRTVLNYIASQCSDTEIGDLVRLFNRIDTNKDGTLSVNEFRDALEESGLSRNEIDGIIGAIDTDKSGKIDYTEFIAATMDYKIYSNEEKLRNAFKRFDADNSGTISAQELRTVLDGEGIVRDMNVWNEMIADVDENGDGQIDIEEFLHMMTRRSIAASP